MHPPAIRCAGPHRPGGTLRELNNVEPKIKVKVGKSLHRLNFPVLTSSFRPLFDLPDAPSAVPPTKRGRQGGRLGRLNASGWCTVVARLEFDVQKALVKVKVKVGKSLHKLNFPVLTSSFRPLFDLPDAPSALVAAPIAHCGNQWWGGKGGVGLLSAAHQPERSEFPHPLAGASTGGIQRPTSPRFGLSDKHPTCT